jgi:magnesium-transporting ATPase (P-type)
MWVMGTVMATVAIWNANIYVVLQGRYYTMYTWIALGYGIFVWVIFLALSAATNSGTEVQGVFVYLFGQPTFWLTVVLTMIVSFLPEWVWWYVEAQFYPTVSKLSWWMVWRCD